MNIDYIRQIINQKGFTINSLSKKLEMSHVGLSKGLEKGTIKVETLERIADVLGVSICTFFENESFGESKLDFLKENLRQGFSYIEINFEVQNIIQETTDALVPIVELISSKCSDDDKKLIMEQYQNTYGKDAPDDYVADFYDLNVIEIFIKNYNQGNVIVISEDFDRALVKSFNVFIQNVANNNWFKFLIGESLITEMDLIEASTATFDSFIMLPKDEARILSQYFEKKNVMEFIRRQRMMKFDTNK